MNGQIILTIIIAFVITAILGPVLIPILHRIKAGQSIREEVFLSKRLFLRISLC